MKVKTYTIRVIQETEVKITLPEEYATEENLKSWQEQLWELDKGVDSIAEYAAEMAVKHSGYSHDGIGELLNKVHKPKDFKHGENSMKIIFEELSDYTETDIIKSSDWEEAE